ncbi:MAG: hypothetical protein H6602_07605 [Flavobacteriales bacterium]|nr:hypothetical protein [Flavobacteriales bacterium]
MARVVIPSNAEKALALAKLVYGKHQADGASSPLNVLQDHNWTDNGPKIALADDLNTQAKELEKKLEKLYQDRDALLKPVKDTLRSSSRTLMGIYKSSPKTLGDWGFEVNDTPQKKKEEPKP